MTFTARQRADFQKDAAIVAGVARGRESSMYGPLRDMLSAALSYDRRSIDIDRAGARGRPDLTVFAPGGAADAVVPWIVLEAKDEHGIAADRSRRAGLFAEKAKYVTADTAWFVMVDPTIVVARPVEQGTSDARDIELPLSAITIDRFAEVFAPLSSELAGIPRMMERFRGGDESLIATEKLSGDDDPLTLRMARDAFFDGLRETTGLLQQAVETALAGTRPRRQEIAAEVRVFREQFGKIRFTPYPLRIEGSPKSYEENIDHGPAARRLTRKLRSEAAMARLTIDALPRFAERAGLDIDDPADARQIDQVFSIETANLILARLLLIRFLEDHGFFDEETPDGIVRRRYLCNGGVQAFQGMRAYFKQGYTRLLEEAYRSGAGVYAAAFNETELDWVLGLNAPELSRVVEWAMYRFSRYDFTTVRGDILTGVYDRFLSPSQRKAKGEFYTPPSIARWMLERLDLRPEDSILDPSCGSGTFLIERYQQVVGEDADRGLATYDEARDAVIRIAGNDLNPFSAILTQIQLLWHLVTFGPAVRAQGLPLLSVAERANSLVPTLLRDQSATGFADIDRNDYAAVVGNPPYVRPERGLDLDPAARSYYETGRTVDTVVFPGINVDRNVFRLFIYRALDHWCAKPDGGRTGKLALVLPLGFCSGADSADLRRLFMPGGRWTIREIVDMELIWRSVFDADVLPMILIAEARAPKEDDRVIIHLADERCVLVPAVKGGRPGFDLNQAATSAIAYSDIFSPDGHILTRLTPQRLNILKILRGSDTFSHAAKLYWTRRRARVTDAVDEQPTGHGEGRWEEQRLIRYGVARRGQGDVSERGLSLWKGENIRTGSLAGEPAFQKVDISTVDSPSVWSYSRLLPNKMFALPLIEQIPCAAPFDPRTDAMLNTVTVFGPRPDLADVPFDAVLSSRIYGYYTILSLRSSYMNKLRSHIYPSIIAALPWSETIAEHRADLRSARETLFAACKRRFDAGASLREEAETLGLKPLRDVFRARAPGATFGQSEGIAGGEAFSVGEVTVVQNDETWTIRPDASSPDWVLAVPGQTLAELIAAGLRLVAGSELNRTSLLRLPIPADLDTAQRLTDLSGRYATDVLEEAVEREVDRIDAIVGPALGLSLGDIAFIQHEMIADPFLSRIRPRYPYFTPKQRGRRLTLERSDRYQPSRDSPGE